MWERLLIMLADQGISWAQRKIDERAKRAEADRAESDRLHADTQRPLDPPGGGS